MPTSQDNTKLQKLQKWWNALLDAIWPRKCELCGELVDREGFHLCGECLMRLPIVDFNGCCEICGKDIGAGEYSLLCQDCSGPHKPAFDRAAFALRFEEDARNMILDYKFNRSIWLRNDFVLLMEAAARRRFDLDAVDMVCPMPLTLFHRLDRGYNQCAYLARELARRIAREDRADIVRRTGHPRRQAGLTEKERRENERGTFAIRHAEAIVGKTVLVVDDVLTTGATLSECARALKDAGAQRVFALTLAKAVR